MQFRSEQCSFVGWQPPLSKRWSSTFFFNLKALANINKVTYKSQILNWCLELNNYRSLFMWPSLRTPPSPMFPSSKASAVGNYWHFYACNIFLKVSRPLPRSNHKFFLYFFSTTFFFLSILFSQNVKQSEWQNNYYYSNKNSWLTILFLSLYTISNKFEYSIIKRPGEKWNCLLLLR